MRGHTCRQRSWRQVIGRPRSSAPGTTFARLSLGAHAVAHSQQGKQMAALRRWRSAARGYRQVDDLPKNTPAAGNPAGERSM